ncbi:hypothetical protein RSAG8_11978, partial [Rhizoctonia solani AG-8 WAC10335]
MDYRVFCGWRPRVYVIVLGAIGTQISNTLTYYARGGLVTIMKSRSVSRSRIWARSQVEKSYQYTPRT